MRPVVSFTALVALTLVLAGCGGNGGSAEPDALPAEPEQPAVEVADGKPAAPEFFFTGERTDAGADGREILAVCGDNKGPGQWLFDFVVPADWEENGKGNAGGGLTGSNGYGDITHTTPDGVKVMIRVLQDNRDHNGQLLDKDQEPMDEDNFDYSFERGIGNAPVKSIPVKYTSLQPVIIDGISVPFASMDQQAAELDASEYITRLRYAEVPVSQDSDERADWSATVSFSWDSERGAFDEATAREILETFRFGQCAQDAAIENLALYGITDFAA